MVSVETCRNLRWSPHFPSKSRDAVLEPCSLSVLFIPTCQPTTSHIVEKRHRGHRVTRSGQRHSPKPTTRCRCEHIKGNHQQSLEETINPSYILGVVGMAEVENLIRANR